ncbi:MAG TPA: methylmalonyl-CoA epimerase [Thermoanaerobaculia bacterium]|nr:methylmalonyl-CoA epimerase [Thermoanaerobaculia bacterium]
MIKKLEHIGIAVRSLDEALPVWRALGLEEAGREEVAGQKVRTAFLPAGEPSIELMEPTADDSPIAGFLARRGPGIHHLCFAVDDIEKMLDELARAGYRLVHRAPVPGARGKKVAFLHPEAGHGVLIELSQEDEP